jgi:hypothetical protein
VQNPNTFSSSVTKGDIQPMELSQIKLPKWAIIGIAALVLFGIGSAIYNSGWSQGFLMGMLTGNIDGAQITPYLVSRGHGWHGGFGFIGGFFRTLFFFFLIALAFKFLGFWRWRRHGWHGGRGGYAHGWYGGPGGHGGPGCYGPYGERVEGHYGPWWQQPYQQQPQGQPAQGQPAQGPQAQQPASPNHAPSSEASGEPSDENKPQPTSWTRL